MFLFHKPTPWPTPLYNPAQLYWNASIAPDTGFLTLKQIRRSRLNISCCNTCSARLTRRGEQRLADYIISRQLPDGSWPLYEGGAGNISATVKAYFALKTAGHDPAGEILQRGLRLGKE